MATLVVFVMCFFWGGWGGGINLLDAMKTKTKTKTQQKKGVSGDDWDFLLDFQVT